MTTIDILHSEMQNIREDLKDLREDLHGMMWRFVGVSSIAGSASAAIVLMLQHML